MNLTSAESSNQTLVIDSKSKFHYNDFLTFLSQNGYVRVSGVKESGEFSVKGDIIDVFPTGYENPIRINIYGSDIEKIEHFNSKNQKTLTTIERFIVNPFNEFVFNQNKRKIKADTFLTDLSSFELNDLIVHVDHGIGRFKGLKNLTVIESQHDCVEISYFNEDRLYIPVENIELLSKYSGNNEHVVLDKLGTSHWQYRKASAKKKINEIADELIKTAAERSMKKAPKFKTVEPYYTNFVNEFPYDETEDQVNVTTEILNDLNTGMPMDRLICGDVGYGKTEVALRGAFNVALAGSQVAVIVPTTLLCRQHYENFSTRFKNSPLKIAQLSRLVSKIDADKTIERIHSGEVDIVVGTHALLADKVKFKKLGLLIIDEEQHFGVNQKEKIKNLKSDIHILSLTATPIPRTLQMSLVGLRDLSIISTAPVNRQTIKTEVISFKEDIIKDAINAEKNRGGQIYYVCPRVKELDEVEEFLKKQLPDISYKIAHGQMTPKSLEGVMVDFYNDEFKILLCTTIVESGLDLRKTNTMIIHNSDKFGLSQLYQLRGRIGRTNIEAYCYYTVSDFNSITDTANQRLNLLKKLDSRGSSFHLASHDLEIRGSGNIIGDQQSGHIREIGLELYHRLLKEKIIELRSDFHSLDAEWSPQINLGLNVLIPEQYVPNLNTRLYFYRRLAYLNNTSELKEIRDEMLDRFGIIPDEVAHLLKITELRIICKNLGIEKFDLGTRGLTIKFRNNQFHKTNELVELISRKKYDLKLRSDQTLVYNFNKSGEKQRISKAFHFIKELTTL